MNDAALLAEAIKLEPELKAYACALAKNRDVADDLVQSAFVKCITHIEQLRDSRRLLPWLKTILRNEFFQTVRRHGQIVTGEIEDCGFAQPSKEQIEFDVASVLAKLSPNQAKKLRNWMFFGTNGDAKGAHAFRRIHQELRKKNIRFDDLHEGRFPKDDFGISESKSILELRKTLAIVDAAIVQVLHDNYELRQRCESHREAYETARSIIQRSKKGSTVAMAYDLLAAVEAFTIATTLFKTSELIGCGEHVIYNSLSSVWFYLRVVKSDTLAVDALSKALFFSSMCLCESLVLERVAGWEGHIADTDNLRKWRKLLRLASIWNISRNRSEVHAAIERAAVLVGFKFGQISIEFHFDEKQVKSPLAIEFPYPHPLRTLDFGVDFK